MMLYELHVLQEEQFGIDGKEVVHYQFICRNQIIAAAMKEKLTFEGYTATIRAFDPTPVTMLNMSSFINELKKRRL